MLRIALLVFVLSGFLSQAQNQKKIGNPGNDLAHGICLAADGGYGMVGMTDMNQGLGSFDHDLFVTKMDSAGNLIWSKAFGSPQNDISLTAQILASPDTGFIVAGSYEPTPGGDTEGILFRIDKQGNLVWQLQIGCVNPFKPNYLRDLKYMPNGDLMVLSRSDCGNSGAPDITLARLASNGTQNWAYHYGSPGVDSPEAVSIEILPDSNIALVYKKFPNSSIHNKPSSGIMKINSSDGSSMLSKSLLDLNINFQEHEPTASAIRNDTLWVAGFIQSAYHSSPHKRQAYVVALDMNLNLLDVQTFGRSDRNEMFTHVFPLPNGKIQLRGMQWDQIFDAGLSFALEFENPTKVYASAPGSVLLQEYGHSNFTVGQDGKLVSVYNLWDANTGLHDMFLNFESQNLASRCGELLLPHDTVGLRIVQNNFLQPQNFVISQPGVLSLSGLTFQTDSTLCFCSNSPTNALADTTLCKGDSVQLGGLAGLVFHWQPAAGLSCTDCPNPWVTSDTTIQYTVAIDTGTSCAFYDTVLVSVRQNPSILPQLPPDTAICNSDSLVLYPGSFDSYLWQDGSTDSTFTAYGNVTGTYYVTVGHPDSCSVSDTIKITPSSPATYTIPDTSVFCTGDSLNLVILGGNTVSWSPSNAVDCDTCSSTFSTGYTGYVYVDIDSGLTCSIRDSFYLHAFAQPNLFLGNDTTLCLDGFYFLNAGPGFSSYQWQDGSMGQTYPITGASPTGYYWVEVTDTNGCSARDSIFLTIFGKPSVNLGPDRVICENETIVLSYSGTGTRLWQDGSSGVTFSATGPGIYWLNVTENGCENRDSVVIRPNLAPRPFLGNDTTLCTGTNFVLDPGDDDLFSSYLWSTGSPDTAIVEFVNSGQDQIIWVEVVDTNGCSFRDSIRVQGFVQVSVNLPSDPVYFCEGDTLDISPVYNGTPDSVIWNTGETSMNITVQDSGVYVVVAFADGCFTTDSIVVIETQIPFVELGPDRGICKGDSILLQVNTNAFITWEDGSNGDIRFVYEPGIYWAGASNGCGFDRDSIVVFDLGCNCEVEVPNVFTPNNDGQNDFLTPFIDCEFQNFRLEIYNRWGTLVAVVDDPNQGWDGRSNGQFVTEGTYFYVVTANTLRSDVKESGYFSLIR